MNSSNKNTRESSKVDELDDSGDDAIIGRAFWRSAWVICDWLPAAAAIHLASSGAKRMETKSTEVVAPTYRRAEATSPTDDSIGRCDRGSGNPIRSRQWEGRRATVA